MDADMPDATSSESEPSASDPPTPSPPIGRLDFRRESHSTRHYQRSDPYSLRDHAKPRRRTVSMLKPLCSKETASPNALGAGDTPIFGNHSPPFLFHHYRDREVTPNNDLGASSSTTEPLSGLGTEVAQRLKGTVDKLRGFSLAELIPSRNDQGSQRKQSIPAISQLVQEAKSFTTTESYGEGEMHAKMRLSQSCNDMCLPPLLTPWQVSGDDKTPEGSLDLTPPEISDLLTLKPEESASPSTDLSSVFRAGSVDELEYPAMSPVGFFTTPASPHSPAGRPRSGSQSPYRRTYSNSACKGVHLKEGVLGKRKAESDDERDSDKRLCLNLCVSSGPLDMDVQTGDL